MSDHTHCNRPDRDFPRMKCGYPLPCPWHTLIIDPVAGTVTIPLHPDTRLGDIAQILKPKGKRKGK